VKFHLTNIYRKLGVPNRAGAVRYALEHQILAA
jgi:DNA-binding CsgD family transcriptional regulator